MVDLSTTTIAKSDQLNSDDLTGGPITIEITRVSGTSDKEQPIAISFRNDGGKPYKPGKSMRRVLVNFWGKDGDSYVGRFLTLYRDPEVTFGKIKVGGIRISHMSHLDDPSEMALAVTKGAKKLFKVKPLQSPSNTEAKRQTPTTWVDGYIAEMQQCADLDELVAFQQDEGRAKWVAILKDKHADEHKRVIDANTKRYAELSGEGPDESQRGETNSDDDDQFPSDDA